MGAAPILRSVWRERNERWGEEDTAYTYEGGSSPLDRVDVFVYRADQKTAMTTFATIGMAAREMPGGGRAELHFAARGPLPREVEGAVATQLANLASYPWGSANAALGWGHMVGLPSGFPGFADCSAVLLTGPFTPEGWAWIEAGEERVRVLNVVPITAEERALGREYPPGVLLAELMGRRDVFAPH